MKVLTVIKLIGTVWFLALLPVAGHALTPAQVFDKVKDAVVVVKTIDAKGKVKDQGSGVLISFGRVATNCHVIEGGASYQVGRGRQLVSATLYAEDGDKDICLLDAKGIEGKPTDLGKAASLKVGDPVYAVGAPKGLELSLSDGIVAQLRGSPPLLIQTTAAISPGSSGGGLFDSEGRLVGLTTLYVQGGQSLNFAMPVEWIDEIKPGRKSFVEGLGQTEWFKLSLALEERKDWQGLLDWAQKWTKSRPGVASSWNALGIAYGRLNRHNDEIEAYRQALRINPEDAYAWFSLGTSYYRLNRRNDAIEAYRQALRINPEYAVAWYNLGTTYGELNRYNDAIEAYRQALRIDPEYAVAWSNLGVVYGELNRRDDEIEAYLQALRINPQYAVAWLNLGVAYGELNRHDDEIEAYRRALRINPQYAEAWFGLGTTYGKLNRNNDAIEALSQALRINPQYADAWFNLGVAYIHSGNRTDAMNAYQELRRIDPTRADKLLDLIVPR